MVTGLIPSTEDASGREWRGYARTLLTALLRRCWRSGATDLTEFWRLLTVAPAAELRPVVAGSAAQPFLDPENARMFASIRSVAVSAASALEHVANQRARAFSVRRWVRNGHGVLFMPYAATQIAALRTVIAMWVRLAIFEALNGGGGRDLRMWFVVDELDALGAIDGLKDAIVRVRKFGGRCVLGFQAISQVTSTYGPEGQTIIENCANTVIFRCSSSEQGGTAQFASRLIGEREVIRRQTARGRDRGGLFSSAGSRRSTNISEQHVTEAAVLAAELEQLPDLCAYLKTASSRAWLQVRLTIGE